MNDGVTTYPSRSLLWLLCEQGVTLNKPYSLDLVRYRPTRGGRKWCHLCEKEKPRTEFWARNNACRLCRNDQRRAKRAFVA